MNPATSLWQRVLLFAWAAVLLSHPLVMWSIGRPGVEAWVTTLVFVQGAMMFLILAGAWGARRAAVSLLVIVVLGGGVEWIGATTGIPFGAYRYTERLQPQCFGVPLVVALAWFIMLPPAWAVSRMVTGQSDGVWFMLCAATALAAWDLFVDPLATQWGWWEWEAGGGFYGIPWTNLAGWWFTSLTLTAIVRPPPVPLSTPVFVYAGTWLTSALGLIFLHDLPGPALIGSLGMGGMLGLAVARHQRRLRSS